MNEDKETTKSFKGCILSIIIAIVVIILAIYVSSKIYQSCSSPNNSDGGLLSRAASEYDITITQNEEFSLSTLFILKPYVNIDNLQITINFSDENKNKITSKTKIIGNVKKDEEYTFSFSITEFSFTEILSISYWNYNVTGGTVSYFR